MTKSAGTITPARLLTLVLLLGILLLGCVVFLVGNGFLNLSATASDFPPQSVGKIPDDVCVKDGVMRIIDAGWTDNGNYQLSYVRNNGDIVGMIWSRDGIWIRSFYWTGGNC